MSDTPFIRGTCTEMCPESETKMRERERLLHTFEMLEGTERCAQPRADRKKVVKSYSRSAAGQNMQLPSALRTPETLLQTVHYLLNEVVTLEHPRWYAVYDFITDRLKSVRQDTVIQQIPRAVRISILQPIVHFHAYSAYRLCEEASYNFDPVLNKRELLECLKMLLVHYDETDSFNNHFYQLKNIQSPQKVLYEDTCAVFEDARPYYESLYILLNLGQTSAMARALAIPHRWKTSIVDIALKISKEYWKGNFVHVCKMIPKLTPLLSATLYLHVPQIRRNALLVMSSAYNSKTLVYPLIQLEKILFYNNVTEVIDECLHYNLTVDRNAGAIKFMKTSFDNTKELTKLKRSATINNQIDNYDLPTLLLDV